MRYTWFPNREGDDVITIRLFTTVFRTLLLCGAVASVAMAQNSTSPQSPGSFTGWNADRGKTPEITVSGTIQQVVTKHSTGSPVGVHILVGSSQGVVNVSAGPHLAEDVLKALSVGTQIDVTGIKQTINGESYLMARQLVVAGQQITIRNEHGFLGSAPSGNGSTPQHKQSLPNGSAPNGGNQ